MTFLLAARCHLNTSAATAAPLSRRREKTVTCARFTFLEGIPAFLGRAR
jgi:hypothetical protein